jgi:hypothetical protein
MSPVVAAAVGALTTISTVGGFLIAHAVWIRDHLAEAKKEYQMIRTDVQAFLTAVESLEAAVTARMARPTPAATPDPDEVAAISDATAKVVALAAVVSAP